LSKLVLQTFASAQVAFAGGDYPGLATLADQMLVLAERDGSATSLALAYHSQLHAHFYRGDLVRAEEYFARWSGIRETADFGQDLMPVVPVLAVESYNAWMQGHAGRARECMAEVIAFALDRKSLWALAVAGVYELLLCGWLREPQRAEA